MSGGTKRKEETLIVRDGEQLSDDDEEIVVSPLVKKFRRTISRIELLPDELLLIIFQRFQAEELILASCVCKRWHCISGDQSLWKALCVRWGRGFLDPEIGSYVRISTGRTFQWEKEKNWKRAYIQLANHQRFLKVQVFHRELADEFQLSWYDAELRSWNDDGIPSTVEVAYPPTNRPDSRVENDVTLKRLRPIPYSANLLNKNGIYRDPKCTAVDFVKGAPVEVQWKAARQHFWGWWEGIVSETNVQEQYVYAKQENSQIEDVRFQQYENRGVLYEPYLWERVYLLSPTPTPGTGDLGVMGGIRMVSSLSSRKE